MPLAPKPIAETSDFIATLRSLHSTTVQPEGEGIVTQIFVKAGDHVRAGAPLVQIDAGHGSRPPCAAPKPAAPGTEADVAVLARSRSNGSSRCSPPERSAAGVRAGAELAAHRRGQARRARRAGREGRVQLGYYRVDAPQAGTVGDIPVRAGDRVTTSTVITTIDDNSGLEVYIQVPLDRSPDLQPGLPVQLLDSTGEVVATNPITFVAPRVDDATQTVLAKSALKHAAAVRARSAVRPRARSSGAPPTALTVPVTAVTRISGQYFCFVAEPGPQGGLVARQKPLQVGELVGNDYVVKSGVKAGDKLIVSGIQKLGDGAPGPGPVARMFVDTFIQRPILASVCSLVIILAGAVAIPTMPVAQYPDLAPPQVNVTAVYNGANAQAVETAVTTPLEQAINGVEGMLYMTSSSTNSRRRRRSR